MRIPRIQFSLFGLLTALAVFGVALACILKFGVSLPLVTILWSLLLIMLMLMPILAWLGEPEWRPFYAGAAWFGWIYTLIFMFGFVTHTPISFGPHAMRSSSPARFPHMFIEQGIYAIYQWVVPLDARMMSSEDPDSQIQNLASQYDSGIWNPPPPTIGGGGFFGSGRGGLAASPFPAGGGGFGAMPAPTAPSVPMVPFRYYPWESFRDIAHALLTALWAALGGIVTWWLARRNVHRQEKTAKQVRL